MAGSKYLLSVRAEGPLFGLSPSFDVEKECLFCQKPTTNPKFCSNSCAAKTNKNRQGTGKSLGTCPLCKKEKHSYQGKYCKDCISKGAHLHCIEDPEKAKTAHSLRRYLLRTRKPQCERCKRVSWQGQKIPLETDHIDGDAKNNKENNLRLLCPNCHALTPTWKARNKHGTRQERRKRYKEGKTF